MARVRGLHRRGAAGGLAGAAALAALAGCAPAPPPAGPPQPWTLCDGRVVTIAPGTPLGELDLGYAGPVRLIRPDTAVTMDYIEDRLNIRVDARDRFLGLDCG